MKKFITLVLALALVLGLAAPAMAFTTDSSAAVDHPYELDIYLVEYDDNDFFGFVSLPKSDRGYAKNEIVAAVVELYVPKNETLVTAEYSKLVLGGENVSLNVTDNYDAGSIKLTTTTNVIDGTTSVAPAYSSADDEITIGVTSFAGKATFKWMFFAKVTDDEASLYAKLIDKTGTSAWSTNSMTVVLDGDSYAITRPASVPGSYTITSGTDVITLYVDKNHKTTGMEITTGTTPVTYVLGVDTNKVLGILDPSNPAQFLSTSNAGYKAAMEVYDDIAVDVFGLDYMLIGNYLRDSFFENLVSADTIIATVDIEPWTAYVTVPDEVIVTPPKTGDAASILGFVMVALSGAGAVALRKRG